MSVYTSSEEEEEDEAPEVPLEEEEEPEADDPLLEADPDEDDSDDEEPLELFSGLEHPANIKPKTPKIGRHSFFFIVCYFLPREKKISFRGLAPLKGRLPLCHKIYHQSAFKEIEYGTQFARIRVTRRKNAPSRGRGVSYWRNYLLASA